MSVLIVINNFLHDFASALWLGSFLLLWFFERESQKLSPTAKSEEVRIFLSRVARQFSWLVISSLVVVFLTGVGRTLTYPAGLGQARIVALIAKHVLLVGLAFLTLWWRARLVRRLKQA